MLPRDSRRDGPTARRRQGSAGQFETLELVLLTVVLTISNEQWLASGTTTNVEDEAKVCFETIRRPIVDVPTGSTGGA